MHDVPTDAAELATLQAYVDGSPALHDAVGARRGSHLVLRPFAQGEYNVNYAFDVHEDQLAENVPRTRRAADGDDGGTAGEATGTSPAGSVISAGGSSGHYLLRVNKGSQMHLADQIGYEFAALRLLEPSGRTPRATFVDGSLAQLPYGVLVEERLPGRPLRYETDLSAAAAVFADIHALPVARGCVLVTPEHPVADIFAECKRMYAAYRTWPKADPEVARRIDALVERGLDAAGRDEARPEPKRRCIVNTEVNSSNFLMSDGGPCYLVDWEKPVLGEPEQDLAHFLVPTTTFWKTDVVLGRPQMEEFVKDYRLAVNGRFDTSGLAARLQDYLAVTCLRGVTWCAMAYVEYSEPGRPLRNPHTFEKIRAYLEPGFLDALARDWFGL